MRTLFAGSDHLRAEVVQVNKIANVEGQVREALPIALELLNETIDAVHEFTRVHTEHSGDKITYGLGQLRLIDWEELRKRCGGVENSFALQDLRQVLILQTESDLESINELSSVLEDFRSEINGLIDRQGESLSDAQAKQVINVVLRLATTVAVGLLAAAFSAMAAGVSVIPVLWPAAVGAIVSGLCAVCGEVIQASRHSPPFGVLLNEENTKLVRGLRDLAACMRSLDQESRGDHENLDLARTIALAATLTSFRAEGLALILDWEPDHEYVRRIRQIRLILADAAEVVVGNAIELDGLAESLESAKRSLQRWTIPNDLRSCLSPNESSMSKWIESCAPSQSEVSTGASHFDAVTCDETTAQTGVDSRSRTDGALPGLVDEHSRSAVALGATDGSPRVTLPPITGDADTMSADTVSSECTNQAEPSPEGRKYFNTARPPDGPRSILEQAAEPDENDANSVIDSIVEQDLGRAVNPLTEM